MVPGKKLNGYIQNFRTILAAIHFNYNICRKSKVDMHGNVKLKVTYPKFKEGEATVKEVKVAQIMVRHFIQWCSKLHFSCQKKALQFFSIFSTFILQDLQLLDGL